MYTLVKAFRKDTVVRNQWVAIESIAALLTTSVELIRNSFGHVQLVLVHNSEPDKELRYDWDNRLEFQPAPSITLQEWLDAAANVALSTQPFNGLKLKKAFYSDALESGMRIRTTYPAGLENNTLPDEWREDIVLSLPEHLTPELVGDNCVFTVAGHLHVHYANTEGVYIQGGGTTLNRSNCNTCGVISFANLGGVKIHPIKSDMLSGLPEYGHTERRLRKPIYVKIDNFNPETQTAFLSLMGALIPMGEVFKEVGDGLFEINLVRYNYLLSFMRADGTISFKELKKKIEQNPRSITQLSMYDVAGRDFIEGILTCSQTFVFVVNSPGVFVKKDQLEASQNPMTFLSQTPLTGPVVDSNGYFLDYLQDRELDTWVINVPPSDQVNRRVNTTMLFTNTAVDGLPNHLKQREHVRAHHLTIASTVF